MAREFPTTASQERMLALFGLTSDGTTDQAAAILTAAGLPENGIPAGLTPAKARKLADSELVALFPSVNTASAVETGVAKVEQARSDRNAEALSWQQRNRERRNAENRRIEDFQRGRYVGRDQENILDDLAAAAPIPADQAGQGLREDY